MAIWGNQIQRVKIVIKDKIIEQVTEFKYLGYCILEHKSDFEDKLQTCNKINGVTRRRFGKQMTHSFSILSDDRSKASSKTVPPHSAI
jgi:hypothetical protein